MWCYLQDPCVNHFDTIPIIETMSAGSGVVSGIGQGVGGLDGSGDC